MVSSTATDQVLVVRPEILRVEDLKGKVLGVAGVRSVSDVSLRLFLSKYGLVPEVDVKIVSLGGSGIRLASLQAERSMVLCCRRLITRWPSSCVFASCS